MTQAYNFCAETHLGAGDTSASVVLSAAIAQVLDLFDFGCQLQSYEDSDYTAVIAVVH